MVSKKINIESVDELRKTISKLGAKNSDMMAQRGVYGNVMVNDVPGAHARLLKRL
jgi:uncharacterized protein with GYD domain